MERCSPRLAARLENRTRTAWVGLVAAAVRYAPSRASTIVRPAVEAAFRVRKVVAGQANSKSSASGAACPESREGRRARPRAPSRRNRRGRTRLRARPCRAWPCGRGRRSPAGGTPTRRRSWRRRARHRSRRRRPSGTPQLPPEPRRRPRPPGEAVGGSASGTTPRAPAGSSLDHHRGRLDDAGRAHPRLQPKLIDRFARDDRDDPRRLGDVDLDFREQAIQLDRPDDATEAVAGGKGLVAVRARRRSTSAAETTRRFAASRST